MKKNKLYDELVRQIEGLIDIEIGNIAYENGLELFYDKRDGIDIYVDKIGSEDKDIFERYLIGHYHNNDLLYLILYFEKEKKSMLNYMNKHIKNKVHYSMNDQVDY